MARFPENGPLDIVAAMIRCALVMFLLAGCAGGGSGSPDAGAPDLKVAPDLASDSPCENAPDAGPPATLGNVEKVFMANCAIAFCHDGSAGESVPGLDLRPGHSRASLVNVLAFAHCGGTRVVPGDSGKSYLFHKLSDAMPCDGEIMPRCETGGCPLPRCEIELVRRWIESGAN